MIGFLANEPVWPVSGGGALRMAALASALAERRPVRLFECTHRGHLPAVGRRMQPPRGVTRVILPATDRSWSGAFSRSPWLGRGLIDARAAARISDATADLRFLMVSHSYLVPQLPEMSVPIVIDFPNLEVARQASIARATSGARRLLHLIEAGKARRWEPTVARRAAVAVAVDDADAETLTAMGARNVVVAPNATNVVALTSPSPSQGHVLAVANAGYGPNRQALLTLVQEIWPLVRPRVPWARLVVAGRGSDELLHGHSGDIDLVGFVDDLVPLYEGAACLAFPVDSGAGTQLKVSEGLGFGLSSVVSRHSARSVPAHYLPEVLVADSTEEFADHLVTALLDLRARHAREQRLRAQPPADWGVALAPLLESLERYL